MFCRDFHGKKFRIFGVKYPKEKKIQLIPRLPSNLGDKFSSFSSVSFKAGTPAALVIPFPDLRQLTPDLESN